MKNKIYSLTKAQKRVWFNSKLSEKATPNIIMVFELDGELNSDVLQKAIHALVEENSDLKSTIYSSGDHLERTINVGMQGVLELVDLTQTKKQADIFWLLHNIAETRFNLGTGPLFHFHLIKAQEKHFYFTILIHPIIVDRYSLKYLVEEISRYYNKIVNNEELNAREDVSNFHKIVELEKAFSASEKCHQGMAHWTHTLKTNQFSLDLPKKGYFTSQEYADSPFFEFFINNELRKKVVKFAEQHQVDFSIVLFSAYQALLYKYTGSLDIIINYSTAVTYTQEKVFGCFENRLPLRVLLREDINFAELIKLTQTQFIYDTHYKDIPINDIVKAVRDKYDSHFSGSFTNTSFDCNYLPYEQLKLGEVKAKLIPKFMKKFVPEKLAIYYRDMGNAISIIADFDEKIDNTAVKNLLQHYEVLLTRCIDEPEKEIAKQPILTSTEYQQIVVNWNNTAEDYLHEFVHKQIEQQAEKTPDAIAIVFESQVLTYQELNEKTNLLAHKIRQQLDTIKIKEEDELVGICLNRSLEMILAIIAVLKAGAAYVPLEPSYPEERMTHILHDTQSKVIVTLRSISDDWPLLTTENRQIICLDEEAEHIASLSKENLILPLEFSNLAYVIYTSGSTGLPKGVMIEHGNVPNLIHGSKKFFKLNSTKRLLQFASMNFDAIIHDIFATLSCGATLYIAPTELRQSPEKLVDYLEQHAITALMIPPALLRILPRRQLSALDSLSFAGDVCDQDSVDYWSKDRNLINGYGPTECTVCCTFGILKPGDIHNRLGRPIPNYTCYILDKHLNPTPIGVIGELYIGGVGVGRGYVNLPEMTRERFIPNPFGKGKIYKSGDLVRYMANGHIEYIGRIDFEVKIRGFRIQLNDIEHVLQLLPGVKQVTTKVWQQPGLDKAIVAYYVLNEYASISTSELRQHLQRYLPEYMVPGYLIELEEIPLMVNGKINKAELPDPFVRAVASEANDNKEEFIQREIWAELFKIPIHAITSASDFFDLGGHSLLATQLASRIKSRIKVEITIKDIFQNSQLRQMTKLIREAQQINNVRFPLQKAPEQELYNPSSSQLRFWYFYKTLPTSTAYNILFTINFTQNVDVFSLRKALTKIFHSNEIFRTSFLEKEGEAFLKIHDEVIFDIPLVDCPNDTWFQEEIDKEKASYFDLSILPLFRCKLFLSETRGITLLFTIHHAIFDGGCLDVFMRELGAIYTSLAQNKPFSESAKTIEFKDFSYSQSQWEKERLFDNQLAYWQHKLAKPLPVLELPTDFKRKNTITYDGDIIRFNLPEELVIAAKRYSTSNKCSLFSLLLSIYNILLYRITHQRDIIIASPIANRNQQELEPLIGLFANVVTYRAKFEEEMQFDELLKLVNEDVMSAQENQELPFDLIVNQVQAERDISRHPIFQTMFVLQSGFKLINKFDGTDVSYKIKEENTKTAKFDLTLILYDNSNEDAISGYFEFNTNLYKRETINNYLQYFINILRLSLENPQRVIDNISLLPMDEYKKIVHDWNATEKKHVLDTIHHVFEQQVDKSPNHIAVVYNAQEISYELLNNKANQLARYLRKAYKVFSEKNLASETIIGLCLDRGIDMVVAMLAALKAGVCYLPLDPNYPPERLSYIVQDSAARIIITKKSLSQKLDFLQNENQCLIYLDSDESSIKLEDFSNLDLPVKTTNLAYIIYTSGSTGKPKGVMLEHKGVINLAYARRDQFAITPKNRILQFASINFDVAVLEVYEALLNGATLYVVSEEVRGSLDNLLNYLEDNKITNANFPSALLRILPQKSLPDLKALMFGGDICDQETINYWAADRGIYNTYGPTETTVVATTSKLMVNDSVNCIGKALDNVKLYVLDNNLYPVPVGVFGELYIGGVCLARGYLHRPDLTVERFLVNPFVDDPSERIYKTGDVVRWRTDGQLEYIGRSDFQVKIRGFRIELGEIEEVISGYDNIQQTAVTTMGDNIDKQLIAYYTQHLSDPINTDELRKFLLNKLPDYMIPSVFVPITKMPLSPNGKIDKKGLPKIDESHFLQKHEYIEPKSPTEIHLVALWQDIFKHKKVGITDDFFLLGGNSLSSIRMLAKIRKLFEKEIPLTNFFHKPDIQAIAKLIDGEELHAGLDMKALAINDVANFSITTSHTLPFAEEPKVILLTGANGFLGNYLLQELLKQTSADIYCLVRGKDSHEIYAKMQLALSKFEMDNVLSHPRVKLLKGDLAKPKVGLDDLMWNFLETECDAIYHNGSLVNHIYTYAMLKPSNVDSTSELIKLAATKKAKVLNYISTLSAGSQFDTTGKILEVEPSEAPPFDLGYLLSKWVSEKMLMSAAHSGIKINIFRPGNITGNMKTGAINFEHNHSLLLLKSCIQLGVAPSWDGSLEMMPVDSLSRSIVKLSLLPRSTKKIFNMANPNTVKWMEYFKLVNDFGYKIKIIPPLKWLNDFVKPMTEDNALFSLREIYLTNPELAKSGPDLKFENGTSQQTLKTLGINYPNDYSSLVETYLTYLMEESFLPAAAERSFK